MHTIEITQKNFKTFLLGTINAIEQKMSNETINQTFLFCALLFKSALKIKACFQLSKHPYPV